MTPPAPDAPAAGPGPAARIVLRAGSAGLGALWLVGAATKVFEPAAAWEFTARLTGGGPAGKFTVSAAAAAEALLGTLMLAGAVRGYVATIAGLAAATWALHHVRSGFGGQVKCGCLALVADSTVDQAITRNLVLLGAAAALLAADFVSRRRAARGAGADPGPSRSGS